MRLWIMRIDGGETHPIETEKHTVARGWDVVEWLRGHRAARQPNVGHAPAPR